MYAPLNGCPAAARAQNDVATGGDGVQATLASVRLATARTNIEI